MLRKQLPNARAALEGAGIRLDDIQGKPFWEARWWAVSKETQNCARDAVRRAGQGEFVRCDVEVYGQATGEETIIVDFSLLPIKDQNGKIVFLLPEGRNITEKKCAEAEIARKNEELQASHELIRRQRDELKSLYDKIVEEQKVSERLLLNVLPYPVAERLKARRDLMALDMMDALARFNERNGYLLQLRIGINSGAVVAGVIGIRKFIYDLWGDAVNIASRMEFHGVAGRVQVTDATRQRLGEPFLFEERGVIEAKGMGELHTWFLAGRRSALSE